MMIRHIALIMFSVLMTGAPDTLFARPVADVAPQAAVAAPRLRVQAGRRFGKSAGELVFTNNGLAYETSDRGRAGSWSWNDIQQLQVVSPTRLRILTYKDSGWWRAGKDRRVEFSLTSGEVSAELVTFLLGQTARPLLTSVAPRLPEVPVRQVAVKHARAVHGTEGVLAMYDDGLLYQTSRKGELRYWRYSDIFAILPVGWDRLDVLAYEGGAGHVRPFSFQLKEPLPDGFAADLWSRVNSPRPLENH